LAYFLKRLVRKHLIVDYQEDNQEKVQNKLIDLLNEKTDGITLSEISITNLDVFENELDKKLSKDLDNYIDQIKNEFNTNFELLKREKEIILALIKTKNNVEKENQKN